MAYLKRSFYENCLNMTEAEFCDQCSCNSNALATAFYILGGLHVINIDGAEFFGCPHPTDEKSAIKWLHIVYKKLNELHDIFSEIETTKRIAPAS